MLERSASLPTLSFLYPAPGQRLKKGNMVKQLTLREE